VLDLGGRRVIASSVGADLSIVSELKAEAPPFADPSYVRLVGFQQPYAPGVWVKEIDIYEGGSLAGVVSEILWNVAPAVPYREDEGGILRTRAVVRSDVGIQALAATGLRRDDLAAVAPVSTTLSVTENERDLVYLNLNASELEGLRIITSDGAVPAPTQLFDARPWGSGAIPRLAFLGLDSKAAGGATHVITWDHEAGRAQVMADLVAGAHGLSAVTGSSALVNSYLGPEFESAAFIVRLDENRPPVEFLGESLWSFTLLEPSYLYNAEDAKFYRLSAPLQRTALPATLAGSADTSGDFHAIRLP
jgi:hypothetical protein